MEKKSQFLLGTFIITIVSLMMLGSCSKTSEIRMSEAQVCLDKAQPSDAQDCISDITDLLTPEAYALRCAADFSEQGFNNPEKLVDMFDAMAATSAQGQSNPMYSMMGFLTFSSTDKANQAVSDCSKADSPTLINLSNMARVSTSISAVSPTITNLLQQGQTPTAADVEQAVEDLSSLPPNDPARQAALTAIGESVLSMVSSCDQAQVQQSYSTNADMCTAIQEANLQTSDNVQQPTAAQIGECLNRRLVCPNETCACIATGNCPDITNPLNCPQ